MTISERFRDLVDAKNLSLSEVAEKSGVPLETVRNIYYGKVTDPKVSTAEKLARYFDISINCLIGKCQHSQEERNMLQYYRACGNHGKSLVHLVARHEALVAKAERENPVKHRVPCLVPVKRVEEGFIYEASQTKEIETSITKAFAAIEMISNAYAPIHCKGDIVLLEDRYPENGERALFIKDGIGFAKDYYEEGNKCILRCINGRKEDIVLKRIDEVECIGTCIGVIRAE
ncbi:MAG: helix-turn-helix domain-containing protein [Lachnospiraceae bacterium]|nr:helix-turn-helix domain-containing protein [Lachnospiraceae bacterium]